MRIPSCEFRSLDDHFNFGRYRGLCMSDVLDINPSYVSWCVKHCTGVVFRLYDEVIRQINSGYPAFKMDALFESKRIYNLNRSTYDDSNYSSDEYTYSDRENDWRDPPSYDRYSGSWAQDIEGYSDDDIDTIFDGDSSAYWNID